MLKIQGDPREYRNFREYVEAKYGEHYRNAIEKIILQSFRDDIVRAYMLTEEEKKAVLYLDKGDTRMLR